MNQAELERLRGRLGAALGAEGIEEVQENGSIVLSTQALLEAGRYLRDEEGLDYLSNLSGVDWIEREQFEVVYHLYAMQRGERVVAGEEVEGLLGPVVLKVRVPRDRPVVPSVTSLWAGALWQERETYDMFGIRFQGHPDLRRIYLWDEFEDYPLRKDYPPEEE